MRRSLVGRFLSVLQEEEEATKVRPQQMMADRRNDGDTER